MERVPVRSMVLGVSLVLMGIVAPSGQAAAGVCELGPPVVCNASPVDVAILHVGVPFSIAVQDPNDPSATTGMPAGMLWCKVKLVLVADIAFVRYYGETTCGPLPVARMELSADLYRNDAHVDHTDRHPGYVQDCGNGNVCFHQETGSKYDPYDSVCDSCAGTWRAESEHTIYYPAGFLYSPPEIVGGGVSGTCTPFLEPVNPSVTCTLDAGPTTVNQVN